MAKYKVGDIFISHTDGKILQVCEGSCSNCPYKIDSLVCSRKGTFCREQIGSNTYYKELPSLPPGTKVKVREDLKVGAKYGKYTFVKDMEHCVEVTIKQYNAAYKAYNIIEDIYNYTLEMFDQVINEPKTNNMETKEIKINVPEGYEIDKENSTFDCIKFKLIKKGLTYKDVAGELFDSTGFFINSRGEVLSTEGIDARDEKADKNNATNKKQLEKLLALNQLLNIAEYYNKKSPKQEETVYCFNFDKRNLGYYVEKHKKPIVVCGLIPMFNRKEDAKAVIDNQNFKEILDLIYKDDEN